MSAAYRRIASTNGSTLHDAHGNDDGSADYHATVSGLNEISWWILGYGDQAEVLQPPELRQLIAGRAKRMAATYG